MAAKAFHRWARNFSNEAFHDEIRFITRQQECERCPVTWAGYIPKAVGLDCCGIRHRSCRQLHQNENNAFESRSDSAT